MEKNGKKLPDYVAYASTKTDKVGDDGKPIWRRIRIGVGFINKGSDKQPITVLSDTWPYRLDLWPPFAPDEKEKKEASGEGEAFDENAVDLSKPAF